MGYKFQFVTLAGFHALNYGDVRAGARLPGARHGGVLGAAAGASSPRSAHGYTATKHQREVGTGYFDEVAKVISGGAASTLALDESTETRAVLTFLRLVMRAYGGLRARAGSPIADATSLRPSER